MVNIWSDDWESGPEEDWSGGGSSSTRLAQGGEMLGATVYELPPDGHSAYHFHHGSEELLVVLRGRPTLRTPAGERELEEGDVVHFPSGPEGAHGIHNRTAEPVRYVMAGTRTSPEVVEYPDLGQITAQSRHPAQTGERLFAIHQLVEPPGE
ncbi:MAG TPA: cupin domain-containing protein [Gaiellaceae bacterium]|nr:cupin domain-containing protein [Gaiellaceae bacterium]